MFIHHRPTPRFYATPNPCPTGFRETGLVLEPEQWAWTSYRHYAYGETGPVLVNVPQKAELRMKKIS